MYKRICLVLLLTIVFSFFLSTVALANSPFIGKGYGSDLVESGKSLGNWLRQDVFGILGLIGFLIGGGLVIFGNAQGLKQIGLILLVLALVASYDMIWKTLAGFFGMSTNY